MSDDIKLESGEWLDSRKEQGIKLLEKWARNDIGKEFGKMYAKNQAKAIYGAAMLENQERHLKRLARMYETAISSSFSTTPENVLKIVKIGVANSIRGDLFHEMALQTPDDAIYYLERKLETTFANRGTAAQIINENVNPYYPSEQIPVTYATGSGSGTGTNTITLQVPNSSPNYVPIRPGKVFITLAGVLVGIDDGAQGFTPYVPSSAYTGRTLVAAGSSVIYSTGVITLVFSGTVTGTDVQAIVSWDSESAGISGILNSNYGTVTLTTRKKRFAARPEPLGYSYSQMTEVLLGSTMGINTEAELIEAVGLEHALAKDYRAIARAVQIAGLNQTYTYNADFASYGEVSENAHAQNLLSKIDLIGGAVFNTKKRGMINKAVVGTNMLTYMRKHKTWEENKGATKEGPYKAGSFGGIEIFACPSDTTVGITANDAILLYKNPREGLDIGLAIGVLTELTSKLALPNLSTVGTIASVESTLALETSFLAKLTLTGYNTTL